MSELPSIDLEDAKPDTAKHKASADVWAELDRMLDPVGYADVEGGPEAIVAYIKANFVPKVVDQTIPCPNCKETAAEPVNYAHDPSEKRHWQCAKCGAVFSDKAHA